MSASCIWVKLWLVLWIVCVLCDWADDFFQHSIENHSKVFLSDLKHYFMSTIVRALCLAAERALFSCNDNALVSLVNIMPPWRRKEECIKKRSVELARKIKVRLSMIMQNGVNLSMEPWNQHDRSGMFKIRLRGGNLSTSLSLGKSQNLPFFGSWSPVGIKVYHVCLMHASFKCFEPRPYLVCHVTTIENV